MDEFAGFKQVDDEFAGFKEVGKPKAAPKAAPKTPDSLLSRIGTGFMDPVHGAAQIADKYLVNPIRQAVSPGASSMADVTKQRDAEYVAPEGMDWGRFGGQMLNPVNWVGPGGPLKLAKAAQYGALSGALTPTSAESGDFLKDKVKQAASGAIGGGLAHGATRLLGGAVKPTAAAEDLMRRGVQLTPGQAAGAGSTMGRIEESLASNPLAATFITPARKRAVEEANTAAVETATKIVGNTQKLGVPAREAAEKAREIISKTYDEALEGISIPATDTRAGIDGFIKQVKTDNPMTHPGQIKAMRDFLNQRILELQKRGVTHIDGKMAKQLDSEIGQHIRDLSGSTDMAAKTSVQGWKDLQQTVRDTMTTYQKDPTKRPLLDSANKAYRQLLAVEKARPKGGETFTPRQLKATLERMGIKNTDMNRVAESMGEVLPNAVANSGTADRLMVNAIPAALMLGGAGSQYFGFGPVGMGLMAAGALGTRTGAKLMTGNTGTQRAIKQALTPYERWIASGGANAMN